MGIDITGVRSRAKERGDVAHVWVPIPSVSAENVIKVMREVVKEATGDKVTYFHCTGGSGRGPSIGVAYMYWLGGQSLTGAVDMGKAVRKISPKVEAVQQATKQLLGVEDVDFSKPLTQAQRETILAKLKH